MSKQEGVYKRSQYDEYRFVKIHEDGSYTPFNDIDELLDNGEKMTDEEIASYYNYQNRERLAKIALDQEQKP